MNKTSIPVRLYFWSQAAWKSFFDINIKYAPEQFSHVKTINFCSMLRHLFLWLPLYFIMVFGVLTLVLTNIGLFVYSVFIYYTTAASLILVLILMLIGTCIIVFILYYLFKLSSRIKFKKDSLAYHVVSVIHDKICPIVTLKDK